MWVKFFVSGKSTAETYRWFDDVESWTDEDLRAEAEEWASSTSQGRLNDHFKYGFERTEKLPENVRKALIDEWTSRAETAKHMLTLLRTPSVSAPVPNKHQPSLRSGRPSDYGCTHSAQSWYKASDPNDERIGCEDCDEA